MSETRFFEGGMLFVGANSARGFVSYYGDMLEGAKRIYILKGGPGTGKSSFLRAAAEYATERGRKVEFYACSSDPDSLDAIVTDGEIVILDGTAPHTLDTVIAGARDEIINLGEFWNAEGLLRKYDEIEALSNKKSECYRLAYRYLAAYKCVCDINLSLVLPCVKHKKAERAVERLFSEIKTGGGFSARTAIIDSVGMKGRVRLGTYEFFADKVYSIEDHFGTGPLFLRLLLTHAERTDTPVRVSYDPVDPERVNAIFFLNDSKTFVLSDNTESIGADTRINMKRFVDVSKISEIRHEYKMNARLGEALMSSAIDAMARAGECHFALEEIYVSCMDFDAKEKYSDRKLREIFGE